MQEGTISMFTEKAIKTAAQDELFLIKINIK